MSAIKFDSVSKKYKLYSKGGLYLRDRITHALQQFNPFNGASKASTAQNGDASPAGNTVLALGSQHVLERDFWALKDVSFEINPGESVGFIGRNGAGKSTILKLLAGVTKATSGKVEVNGKVAALIEVGAGFHPELTGRENVYLNGSILGMKKAELDNVFDNIVAFAELEEFIDTPVKHYSSGMYVRLGFAIAAHTNPDIYLIDEVLAVGDESFQKKCLDTLIAHKTAGKTMILVSHNLEKVEEVCDRVIYMNHGQMRCDGSAKTAIQQYRKDVSVHPSRSEAIKKVSLCGHRVWPDISQAPGNDIARLISISLCSGKGQIIEATDIRQPVQIVMEYEVAKPGHILVPNLHFYNESGVCIFFASDHEPEWMRRPRPIGRYTSTMYVPGNFLAAGRVRVEAVLSTMEPVVVHFHEKLAIVFEVIDSFDGDSARGDYRGPMPGFVWPILRWTTQRDGEICTKPSIRAGVSNS